MSFKDLHLSSPSPGQLPPVTTEVLLWFISVHKVRVLLRSRDHICSLSLLLGFKVDPPNVLEGKQKGEKICSQVLPFVNEVPRQRENSLGQGAC